MKITVETVTPEIAVQMLSKNTINRALRKRHVEALAKQMKDGKWLTTSQGIAIAEDGTLLDGQHRLNAIIRHGEPVEIAVARDCQKEIFSLIDQCMFTRTMADSTNIPRKNMEVVAGLYSLSEEGSKYIRLDPVRAHEIYSIFQENIQLLHNTVGSYRKYFSSKPIRTAAVLHMQNNPESAGYVLQAYRNLVTGDQSMPPVQWAFWKSVMNGSKQSVMNGGAGERDRMMRAWIVLNPKNRNKAQVRVKKDCKAFEEMSAAYARIFASRQML